LESDRIFSEIGFSENAKGAAISDGFTLHAGQSRANSGATGRLHHGQDSRQTTLINGNRKIQQIASIPQIKMPERLVSQANRLFKLAVENNFTKGRASGFEYY
jgi:transcription factor IIIB subunit 2